MDRFKMSFNNSRAIQGQYNNMMNSKLSSVPSSSVSPKNIGLNTPMIDRIYKAKPGCSACGKKVA